ATIASILLFAAQLAQVAKAATPTGANNSLTAALEAAHPTPTFTDTPTSTPTYSPTPTSTPTASFTNTPTDTPTPLYTNTPTPTPPACPLTWQVVNSPNGSDLNNYLMAVAAVSASNVWAVGYFHFRDGGSEADQSLVEHWDG